MSGNSKIEWTEATWNPVTGCTKVSPGCAHCYAERITNRWGGPGAFDKVVLHPKRLELPLHWKRPRMIFVNSMSDLFHEKVPVRFIADVFNTMASGVLRCKKKNHEHEIECWDENPHIYQILTKRPDRMLQVLKPDGGMNFDVAEYWPGDSPLSLAMEQNWPLPNVWLGVSVENQRLADQRIPLLLQTPAAVRWLSVEPLLAPVDLTKVEYTAQLREILYCAMRFEGKFDSQSTKIAEEATEGGQAFLNVLTGGWFDGWDSGKDGKRIDWVVVGGESGPKARPMHTAWARPLRDQCIAAGVPFFFKQWGEWAPCSVETDSTTCLLPDGRIMQMDPTGYELGRGYQPIKRVGKKKAGRLLDGREWNQMPQSENQTVSATSARRE